MQGISIRRSFPHLPPATVCLLSPFAAYTARRFLHAFSVSPRLPHVRLTDSYMRFRLLPAFRTYCPSIPTCSFDRFPAFRTYCPSIPTCAFGLSTLSARTARQSLPALSDFPLFPHVQLADPYLRFQPFPIFRMYNPPIPTCAFGFLPFSACTARQSLPALSTSPCLPHVHPADSYLCFRPHPVFRTYTPPIPTCVSDHAASFARTPRQSLPALSVSYRFPHVRLADPYLRFRFPPIFRMYGLLIPTCAFDFLPFPHVRLADPYLRFRFPPIFRMYRSPVPTCAFDRFSAFRMYCQSIPTCAFGLSTLSACTTR